MARGDRIPEGYEVGQIQQFTPEQMKLFKSMFSHVGEGSYLSRLAGGDQSLFNEMEAPALRQFSELQGNIGSRFSGMGMGAQRSSGFQNTMSQAGSNFAQDLQARRQELQRNAIKDLAGMSHELLNQRPYERFMTQSAPSPWQDVAGKFAGAIPGAVAGFMAGGPPGAAMGAASSVFSNGQYNALPGIEDQFRTGQAYMR